MSGNLLKKITTHTYIYINVIKQSRKITNIIFNRDLIIKNV